jgi:hypothetical protein
MKKVLGWIFISISVLNFIGIISSSSIERTPIGILILLVMFFGGIALISTSKKSNEKNDEK